MNPRTFQVLLILTCIIGIAGGAIDYYFPQLISDSLNQAYENEEMPEFSGNLYVAFGLLVVLLAASIIGFVGLFFFKNWGRSISLVSTVAGLFIYPFMGAVLASGWASMFTEASILMWGFLLAASYYSPLLNEKFSKQGA